MMRIAIIGGGISGLAAAHRLLELSRGFDVVLLEAGSRVGGVVGTERIGEYLVETGADMFITSKPQAVSLCRRLGLESQLISTDAAYRRSLVLRRGKPVEVPEGFQLLSPVKIWPVLTSPLFSPWGKMRMGLEYFLPRRGSDDDESLASFVRRRFGTEAFDRLIQPLVGGIYTANPEKLSLHATLSRFVDMEREHGSLIRAMRRQAVHSGESASGARYGLFVALKDGLGTLLAALENRVRAGATLRLQTAVNSIRPRSASLSAGGIDVELADGTTESFDAAIVATPAHRACGLIEFWLPEAAAGLKQIEYASAAIVVSGHRLEDIRHPMDAFGLVIPAIERRRVLAVSFASRKFPDRAPPGRVLLRTFVGGAMQPEMLDRSDEELCQIVREELCSIFGVRGREDFMKVVRWTNAMPQYHVGHLERVAAIDRALAHHPKLRLAGNAFHGVGVPDCVASGEQAAEAIAAQFEEVPLV